jgi:uncharacterized protein (TIGR03000 family)
LDNHCPRAVGDSSSHRISTLSNIMCRSRPVLRAFVLSSVSALLLPLGVFGPSGGALRAQGPRDAYPPSYYGYNLDDPHPGYFGGGRYNEYYKFGRGYWLSNYPDSVPWFPDYKPWIRWQAPPPADAVEQLVIPSADATCHIELRVPADAEVFIEGKKTQQTGALREFVSPALTPDQVYLYSFRARWKENGRTIEQSQDVPVRAGTRSEIVFPVLPPREALPAPKPLPPDPE